MRVLNKVIDLYLKSPLIYDGLILLLLWILSTGRQSFDNLFRAEKGNLGDIYSNLISTCISLAGFLLAALTIIVTFRSNIKAKGFSDSSNALEFILSGGYYKEIVSVYSKSIVQYIIIALVVYFFWLFIDSFSSSITLTKIAFGSIICVATTTTRSLWVLFKILNSEFVKKR